MNNSAVLVVNDQPDALELKRIVIGQVTDAEIITAHSKKRALDLLDKRGRVQIAYIDVNTWENEQLMNQLTERLLKDGTQVVLTSASSNQETKDYAKSLNLDLLDNMDNGAFKEDLEKRLSMWREQEGKSGAKLL